MVEMPRRSVEETERTRETIVGEAVTMASTDGLEGLTIGRLADQVGMSKSGLIRHFGTRERLQLAALERAVAIFTAEVWEPVAGEPEGLVRLRAVCEFWLSYLRRGVFPGGCFLSAASLEFDDRPGPVRDAVAAHMERWLGVLGREAKAAVAAGELPPDTDPRQLAFELNAVFMGANWSHRLLRDPQTFTRARRAIDRLLTAAS
jgi:AcrR family transcriptional regulator